MLWLHEGDTHKKTESKVVQCTSSYRLRKPRRHFPPQKFPSRVWQWTCCRLPPWTRRSFPLLMTCKGGNFCSWCKHLFLWIRTMIIHPQLHTGWIYKTLYVKEELRMLREGFNIHRVCEGVWYKSEKGQARTRGLSHQDQQRGSPGRPCSSPGGSWGLPLPACASLSLDSRPCLLAPPQNQHEFCCQCIIEKHYTKWWQQRN